MLEVIKAGFYTSVQDLGRWKHRNQGIPSGGAMDHHSAQFANKLVNNSSDEALLEITQIGPTLSFHKSTVVAFSGAKCAIKKGDESLSLNKAYFIEKGELIRIGYCSQGVRLYMAIKGGILSKKILGSRSWDKYLYNKFRCVDGDTLEYNKTEVYEEKYGTINTSFDFSGSEIEVYPGPEFHALNEEQKLNLLSTFFHISNLSNRMAYQLDEPIKNDLSEMLSGPVLPGTVQLSSAGKLIILMKDSATTGGYPRVLQLTHHALSSLSQKSTKQIVKFKMKA